MNNRSQGLRIFFTIGLMTGLLGISACDSEKDKKKGTDPPAQDSVDSAATRDSAQSKKADSKKISMFIRALPSPLHISTIFSRAGLEYRQRLTHDPSKASDYVTNYGKSLNLGIYSTDLAYCTLNEQTDAAIRYLKSVRTMSESLGLSSVFERANLMERFEANIGNQDSLLRLISDTYLESDLLLKETKQMDIVALSFAGAWIESMHIATQLIDQSSQQDIKRRVVEQRVSLDNLLALLSDYSEDKQIAELHADFKVLKSQLDTIVERSSQNEEGDLVIDSEDFGKLTKKVAAMRKEMIALA